MTEQGITEGFCEICGMDVAQDSKLKRFGKFFCSEEHMNQYVKARQKQLGLGNDREAEEKQAPRRRRWGC